MSTTRSRLTRPRASTPATAFVRARLSWIDAAARKLAAATLGALRSPLYRSGYALLANAAGTTALGAIYWAVAAHLYDQQALGRTSALIAALIVVSNLAQLNLHSALARFLPRAGRSACRFVTYSYAVSSLAAVPLGLAFVTILPRLSPNWRFVGDSVPFAVVFVLGAVAWGVFNLEDAALVGLRRSVIVPAENMVYGLCKLILLAVIAVLLPSTGIFVSWVAPLVVIIPAVNWLIFHRYLKDRDFAAAAAGLPAREVVRFASIDYVGAVIGQATGGLLPLLVLSVLGAAANGSFYIAWTIAAGLTLVTANFAYSLLAEGATAPHRLPELTRGVLVRCAVVTVPGVALLVVAAHPILRIYGSAYAADASVLLGLLALAAIPTGLVSVAFSLDRLAGRVGRAAFTQGVLAVFTLGGSWLLLRHLGIDGVGVACLGGSLVVAVARFPTIAAAVGLRADPAPVDSPAGPAATAWPGRLHLAPLRRLRLTPPWSSAGAAIWPRLRLPLSPIMAGAGRRSRTYVRASLGALRRDPRLVASAEAAAGKGGTSGHDWPQSQGQGHFKLAADTATVAQGERGHGSLMSTAPEVHGREPMATFVTPPDNGLHRHRVMTLALSALFGAALVLVGVGYALDIGVLRLVGVLGAVFFGVGTAPLQLSERSGLVLRLGVAGVVGLSVLTLVGSVMVLTPMWHPLLAATVIGVVAVGVHVQACRRALTALRGSGVFRALGLRWRDAFDTSTACSFAGTVLWCAAALSTAHVVPGVGGFLPVISPLWYAGLVLLLAGMVLARGKSEPHAMFAVVSLVAALTLTPALVYGMPRSQSAAKHVDLVQLILSAHHLDPGAGIYQAYSGFFSAIAWVCDLAGIHESIGLATYWPFVIGLVGLAELRFFFGGLISSRYRIWVALTLVVLVNAIGADYFSPQSVGFVLAVGVYRLALWRKWPGLSERMRIALLVLAGCALAVTHELSPYLAGGVLVVLVIFRLARPWYVPATCILPAIFWAAINWRVVSGFVSFGDIGDFSNYTPPKMISAPGLQRLAIVGESSQALLLGLLALIALAGVGFARNVRRPQAWAFMISAGVGLFAISANPYGNEGIFRAALFGIPWLALVAIAAVPGNSPRWMSAAYGAASVGLLGTCLVALFGLDNAGVIRPADLQAFQAYETHAPVGSYILTLSYGDYPAGVTFPLPQSTHYVVWPEMSASAQISRPVTVDAGTLAHDYIRYAAENGGASRDLYAIWSPAAADYSVDYGLETLGQSRAWRRLIAASPDWRVVFNRDGTYLFQVVVPAPGGRPGSSARSQTTPRGR